MKFLKEDSKMHNPLQRDLSKMQGDLFLLSSKYDYDSFTFIKVFMTGELAKHLDAKYDFLQWAGKEYILEKLEDEYKDKLVKGNALNEEVLYWIGYTYRWWHFYTGESSKEIYRQAPAKVMASMYYSYHTLSVELAIDKLKSTYQDKLSNAV